MAIITGQIKLTPTATGSLPSGTEGAIAYDSTVDSIVQYGTAWAAAAGGGAAASVATGGLTRDYTVSSTDYRSHTFIVDGNFIVLSGSLTCDVLVVAGGGGGGSGHYSGGGGAGGMRALTSQSISGTTVITIGLGGQCMDYFNKAGFKGQDSKAGSILTCIGGGYGGYSSNGGTGGSGGGGTNAGNRAAGTANQGNAGGDNDSYGSGGGGGAGSVGADGQVYVGGQGGNPAANSYRSGFVEYYAGGGGGTSYREDITSSYSSSASQPSKIGGNPMGGGGEGGQRWNGGWFQAQPGRDGTGGGGGGAEGHPLQDRVGEKGGSGIVIIRYAL